MSEELKSCPFCGCKVEFRRYMQVQHPENECILSALCFNDAFEDWNRRSQAIYIGKCAHK